MVDPSVERLVADFVRAQLGASVVERVFETASIARVVGLVLTDGRRVVVKVQPGSTPLPHLRAATAVQRALALEGFPAPRVLAGPVPLGAGHATIEELVEPGPPSDATHPDIRAALATGLADLIESCSRFADQPDLASGQFPRDPGALYPPPHSPLFDFEATAAGAEWIDAHARRARAVLDRPEAPPVVGHDDWRVEHVRFDRTRIVAVYDWASLKSMPETTLVGNASRAYSLDFTMADIRYPDRGDALAFIADYESARRLAFTRAERRHIDAAWLYSLAYGARCEHSLHATTVDPVPRGFRDVLAGAGDSVLA
jgi:hypothetical protein